MIILIEIASDIDRNAEFCEVRAQSKSLTSDYGAILSSRLLGLFASRHGWLTGDTW